MERRNINIEEIAANTGQIDGLPKNPRTIKDERFKKLVKSIEDAPEMLEYRTLLVMPHDGKFVVVCGNMRYRACKAIGYKVLPCVVLAEDTPAEKLREYAIKDNIGFGDDDWDALKEEWNTEELKNWGYDLTLKNEDEAYTHKIEIPIYNPIQDEVKIGEMMDRTKTDELVEKINKSTINEEVKSFLRFAAERHTVFNYERIADYYSTATDEEKRLFEDSALVVIDFGRAIELGFVEMTKRLNEIYGNERG